MSVTASTMLPLGTQAPPFSLPDTNGHTVSLDSLQGASGLLVMFICNHCPYVKHVRHALTKLVKEYQAKGIAVVAINSNDVRSYPEDSPQKMREVAAEAGYTFPFLFDETQDVAKAYRAACTPDFYVFDDQQRLVYRGQMDDSRPGNGRPVTGTDLRAALEAVLGGHSAPDEQVPSAGCNIKWKPGNEPDYY